MNKELERLSRIQKFIDRQTYENLLTRLIKDVNKGKKKIDRTKLLELLEVSEDDIQNRIEIEALTKELMQEFAFDRFKSLAEDIRKCI